MSDRSKISWTDATWGITRGCKIVSEGCRNCYAMRFAHRFPKVYPGLTVASPSGPKWTGKIQLVPEKLDQPLRWKKPRRIFVNSMSDLFHDDVPDIYIAAAFAVMAATPRHTYQILTKRPERMRIWVQLYSTAYEFWAIGAGAVGLDTNLPRGTWPLPNVWLGTSVEDQKSADERIPQLLSTPAAVRWISAEPLLGPVDLRCLAPVDDWHTDALDTPDTLMKLDWVVVGGESGPRARPMNPHWARSIRDQCQDAGTAFHFKQWGEWVPDNPGPHTFSISEGLGDGDTVAFRVGKKAAGRVLDGRTWDEYPEAAA